jgi:hypothetical protein
MKTDNFEGAPFGASLWVPPNRMASWLAQDLEGAHSVLLQASLRLGASTAHLKAPPEEKPIVARLVLAGGDEVSLLHLAATGLISCAQTFASAAVWVKRRRAAGTILNLPIVVAAQERLVEGLGPLGWETPDTAAACRVVDAIRELEGILMVWQAIRPKASEADMQCFARSAVARMGLGESEGE